MLTELAKYPRKCYFGYAVDSSFGYSCPSTWFLALNCVNINGAESAAQIPIVAGKFTKIKVRVDANASNGNTIIGIRRNGTTILSVTIPAGQTGTFTATGDAAVNENDLVNWIYDLQGTTGTVYAAFGAEFQPS